jgi:hypothetical protein
LKDQDVANREVSIEIVFLWSETDQPARRTPIGLIVVAEHANRAVREAREPDDRIDRRRFAGTVRSQKPEEFAVFNAQRNIVDGREVAVTFYEAIDLDGGSSYGM